MDAAMFQPEFIYTVDFRPVKYYRDLYKCLKVGMDLPAFFGENLDALWDCLTGFIGWPCEIRLTGLSSLSKQRREELQDILDVLEEGQKKYPQDIHIVYVD